MAFDSHFTTNLANFGMILTKSQPMEIEEMDKYGKKINSHIKTSENNTGTDLNVILQLDRWSDCLRVITCTHRSYHHKQIFSVKI